MNVNINKALAVMEETAIRAALTLEELQHKTKRLESRKDFLTDADLKSEEIILLSLEAEFPGIPSFSEEKGGTETNDGYLWIIDPLDGTINFFLQDDHWGISVALVENSQTVAGVVCLPAKKQLFSASREIAARFCFIEGKRKKDWKNLYVNQEKNLADSQFWVGWGKEEHEGEDHKRVYDVIKILDRNTLYPQIRNSAVADMMMVASGKIAGYVFPKPEPFDIAAAGFIVERAGGRVTDIDGNLWNSFSRSLIATNNVIHEDLVRILKK